MTGGTVIDDDPDTPAISVPELDCVVALCPARCTKGYHSHGRGSVQGHRVSHCTESTTPSGYYLRPATPEEREAILILLRQKGKL